MVMVPIAVVPAAGGRGKSHPLSSFYSVAKTTPHIVRPCLLSCCPPPTPRTTKLLPPLSLCRPTPTHVATIVATIVLLPPSLLLPLLPQPPPTCCQTTTSILVKNAATALLLARGRSFLTGVMADALSPPTPVPCDPPPTTC